MSEHDNSYETSSFSSSIFHMEQSKRPARQTNFEQQSTIHRLSRFPDRFNAKPKLPSSEDPSDPTPFATSYFRANPDAADLSTPEEKLESLTKLLESDGLSTSDKFTALAQQKTMRYLIYGDDSIEMLRSYAAIGVFYNENKRYESAIRNLEMAHKMEEQHPLEEADSFLIALETAEAHLAIKKEQQKHVSQAESVLQPFDDYEVEDAALKIRYDLAKARILEFRREYDEAEKKYKEAIDKVDQSNPDETLAKLYVEVADACINADDLESAEGYLEKAKDMFKDLKYNDEAEMLENQLEDLRDQIKRQKR